MEKEPMTELDSRYSSENVIPTSWAEGRRYLEKAEVYWLTTLRPDGRPHLTPVVGVWLDGALYFGTGPGERKAKNLESSSHCLITTGCNTLSKSLDVVIEADAEKVKDEATLRRVAGAFASKYDPPFHFTVRDGAFYGEGGPVSLFKVSPSTAFGFARGEGFGHTRWRF